MLKFLQSVIVSSAIAFIPSPGQSQETIFSGKPIEYEKYGYFVRGAAWPLTSSGGPEIFVCWENASPENEQARTWVADQIAKTWQHYSTVKFKGWSKCAPENSGIRIRFNDEGPHVKAFGKFIDGVKSGMVLNDNFLNWSQSCQSTREFCIRSIAAHEFGHALGFAHEQNRPDTPGECSLTHGQGQKEEILLTPYDPTSVMNYCNRRYNNNGELSELDVKSLQFVYGRRQ